MHRSGEPMFSSPDQATVLDTDAPPGSDGESALLQSGQHLGPYRISRVLGEGGMGAVYLAEQLEPVQRPVALKLIRDQLRGGLAEAYFMVERQALARMDHPAIAKVYDAGTTPQGFPFFAMEWIDGPTLGAHAQHTRNNMRDTLTLFIRICRGVQHAHQKGVIHRDLKPNNVLIATIDGQPFPKIIDFGVAIGAANGNDATSTPLMQRAGTRGYMSPEQIVGEVREIDVRSDVYALGVMLLEMLAAPALFDHASALGVDNLGLQQALLASLGFANGAPRELVRGVSGIPIELRWALSRAMAPARADRYDSAEAFAADLERFQNNAPLHAVPATRSYRLRKFGVRHRAAIVATSLALLALLLGLGAAVYGMLQAREAESRALIEADKSRVTSQFLTDVLSGVDPEQARDLDKKLLHLVLDGAAQRAERELNGQPEVLAKIDVTIGGSYRSLSEYKSALKYTQLAYDVAHKSLGPDARLTLEIERQLSTILMIIGKNAEAQKTIESNVAAFERTRGPEDIETLRSAVDLAEIKLDNGSFADAEARISKLLPTVERVAGPDSKLAIDALNDHASLLTALGRYDEAEPIFRDVIARQTALWGAQSPKTLDSQNAFSIMYMESHRFAEAEKILQALLPIEERLFGPDHAVTIEIVSNLAGALRQQATPEKIAASGPYYKRAFDETRKKFGELNANAIVATHNYANYLLDVGDTLHAISLQQQALAASIKVLGKDHPVTGEIHFGLGKALSAAGRFAEAEPELLAALPIKQTEFGADHWRMDEYMAPLVKLYSAWSKPQQASEWTAKRAGLHPKPN